jgi:hypothetical protein
LNIHTYAKVAGPFSASFPYLSFITFLIDNSFVFRKEETSLLLTFVPIDDSCKNSLIEGRRTGLQQWAMLLKTARF